MEKVRKTAQVVGYVDVTLSLTAVLFTAAVVFMMVPYKHYVPGIWLPIFPEKFYPKDPNDTANFLYLSLGILALFTLMGILAGITLIKSANAEEDNGRALAMVWFWMYCNIPLVLVYVAAGFLFTLMFILALLRPIYVRLVWKYLNILTHSRLRGGNGDVPDMIVTRRKSSMGPKDEIEYVYDRRVKYWKNSCIMSPEERVRLQQQTEIGWKTEVLQPEYRNNLRMPACQCTGTAGGPITGAKKGRRS